MKRLHRVLFVIFVLILFIGCNKNEHFDSVEWKNWIETEANPNTGWLMLNNLLTERDLKLQSKNSILNLLGKPDFDVNNEYHYNLGSTGKGINSGTLIIRFKDKFVIEVEVYEG